jgi:hypothetical protein
VKVLAYQRTRSVEIGSGQGVHAAISALTQSGQQDDQGMKQALPGTWAGQLKRRLDWLNISVSGLCYWRVTI